MKSMAGAALLWAATAAAAPTTQPGEPGENAELYARQPAQGPSDRGVTREGEESRRSESLVHFGPMVGIGLPNLLNLGGTVKITPYAGAGLNLGVIPAVHISYYGDATVSYLEYDVYGRVYPFGSGFFLGTGIGYESATGTFSDTIDASAYAAQLAQAGLSSSFGYESEGSIRTLILIPQIGYLHTFDSGFSAGFDLGVQVPVASSSIEYKSHVSQNVPAALAAQYLTPADQKVRDTLERVARVPLPSLSLRMGWMF